MKRFLSICIIFAGISMLAVGCGDPKPTNIMDGASDEALQSYEEMIAAENAAMDADPGDADE